MARRYTRDNRGRFASVGATARGGRLRTAAGNRRATQTERLAGGKPAGTVGKPKGLKPGSLTPKSAVKPAVNPKISKAEKAVASAQKRLKTKQYGSTANQGQALLIDRRIASMTPQQYGAQQVRSSRAMVQRQQRALRDPINADAPKAWRDRMNLSLAASRNEFKAAAADYRLLNPKQSRKRK